MLKNIHLPKLAFGNSLATELRSPRGFEDIMTKYDSSMIDLEFKMLNFKLNSYEVDINGLSIMAVAGTPMRIKFAQPADNLSLYIPISGSSTLLGSKRIYLEASKTASMTSSITEGEDLSVNSFLILNIDRERLQQTASIMLGLPVELGGGGVDLDIINTRELNLKYGAFSFDSVFRALANSIDLYRHSMHLLGSSGIDELFYRNIVMLLVPEKFLENEYYSVKQNKSPHLIQKIIEYSAQYPEEKLTLTDMERMTGLSSRALQYAFRDILDTTPTIWIRKQKLTFARSLIIQNMGNMNITTVALTVRFGNLSIFARYYKEEFGELPSETLTKAKRFG
jgi:AraC-like DNA-binding protein